MRDPATTVQQLLRLMPESIPGHAFTRLVNHALRGQEISTPLADLAGKRVRLSMGSDSAGPGISFEITANGVRATHCEPHGTMRGSLRDFAALALRREDPDTLFFQRRLVVEGETETGLHLKNLLDGWEYDMPAHLRAVLPAPVAHVTAAALHGVRVLRDSGRLPRPSNRGSNRPAARARAADGAARVRPWHREMPAPLR